MEVKRSATRTKKKKKKQTLTNEEELNDTQHSNKKFKKESGEDSSLTTISRHKTDKMESTICNKKSYEITESTISRNKCRRIFVPEPSKWLTPSEKKQEKKVIGSKFTFLKERKRSTSKKKVISYRNKVRRESLIFTVTDITEEEIALRKVKPKMKMLPEKHFNAQKVSLDIQRDIRSLKKSECDVKVIKLRKEDQVKPVNKIINEYKVSKLILDSPGSYEVLKPKSKLIKENSSLEGQRSEIKKIGRTDFILNQNEINESQEVLKPDYSSNQNLNEESDSDIEMIEEVIFVNSSSKTPKELEFDISDESDIDEASGTESDIVPCDDNLKMFTDEENRIYHEKLKERERKRRGAEMEQLVQDMLQKDEKEVEERMKKCSEIEQEGTATEKSFNKKVIADVDSNKMLSKLYSNEAKKHFSKENEKESVLDNEEIDDDDDEDIEAVLQTIISDTGCVESIRGLRKRFDSAGQAKICKANVKVSMQNGNSDTLETNNISSITSKVFCDSSKSTLNSEKTVFNETISSEATGDVSEHRCHSPLYLLKGNAVDTDEMLEVLLTSRVDDCDEEHVSSSPSELQSKNPVLSSSQPVSPHVFSSNCLSSTTQHQCLSQYEGEMVGNTKGKVKSPALTSQSERIVADALNKEHISQNAPCKLKYQSQIKSDVTTTLSTTLNLTKQNLGKESSTENKPEKKHKNMNDSIMNIIRKADKKKRKSKVGENYDRINYLVQASRKVFKIDKSVSSQLGSLAISFGRRLPQVRLDSLLKREMCKGCGVYLVYGENAKVRQQSKSQTHLVVTCMTCHTIKIFVTNPNYHLWNEQPEAQV